MQNTSDGRAAFSRPRDRSLEAYKAWITDIAARLTTNQATLNMTEREWIESWKEYWKQRSKAS